MPIKLEILEKFVNLKLEPQMKLIISLEQLRALDNNLEGLILALAKSSPIGVDTQEDYLAIKNIMEYKSII